MHTTSWIVKSTAMVHRVPGSAGPHGMGSRIWSPRGARRAREARRARGARRAREGRKLSCGCFDFCLPGAPEHQNWSYTPKKGTKIFPQQIGIQIISPKKWVLGRIVRDRFQEW